MQKKISALGLDLGSKRIGVAGCDGTGLIATGLTTIKRTSFARDVAQLRELVQQRQVQILVVGLPYSLDGTFGPQAKKVQKLALRLSAALQLPVEYEDERLTSLEAQELVKAQKRSHSSNKGIIDRKAAAIILQQWLDRRRGERGRGGEGER
ncbi:MAG: Holliday junction resolvase RuvX, partial [Symploca sp. SIO2E9]|nr:Holliday junction resolvase RuvX [Symploca sp. SIO2E9]